MLAAASGVIFWFDSADHPYAKFTWWSAVLVLMLWRLFHSYKWSIKSKKGELGTACDLTRFRIGASLTASLWAFYCIYFYASSDIYELCVSMVIVATLAGGASTVLSGDRFISLLYPQILLIPYSILLTLSGKPELQMLGVLGLLFSCIIFFSALKAAQFTLDSIRLRYQHTQLLKNMKNEVESRTERIIELSQLDSLTKLLNRPAFIEAASQQIKHTHNSHLCVFFIDLDSFKPVNDNFGHHVGDNLLKQLASRLKENFGNKALICRWGGDEFIIMTETTHRKDVDSIAKEINIVIESPFIFDGYKIDMDASIGVSIYPTHSRSLEELISFADVSMYENKHTQKADYVLFSKDLAEKVQRDFSLSSAIRKAVPPDVFIPLAEKNGAIREIGYWVLENTIQQQHSMMQDGLNIKICINVSIVQFEDPGFVNSVKTLIDQYKVAASLFHIEITESVFSSDKPKLLQAIKQLQTLGLFISIDDFGTGYSSLSVIQDLGVNIVKVDRSFVNRLDSNGAAIVKAVMLMANELNYKVVAEGVETPEQEAKLKALGVHYLQGYLFSKPQPYTHLIKQFGPSFQSISNNTLTSAL
jgi:diguanylate cyclase (GGDEF)-like protein